MLVIEVRRGCHINEVMNENGKMEILSDFLKGSLPSTMICTIPGETNASALSPSHVKATVAYTMLVLIWLNQICYSLNLISHHSLNSTK